MPGYWEHPTFQDWVERVNQALKILDVIDEVENLFDEPMYLCDMKHEHFGLSEHHRIKILDSDSVHFKSIAGKGTSY